jgi:hypothetical protein
MHRPGCDPDSMTAEDFLCDFCGRDWTHAAPFVEGHHGACICGECLRAACAETAAESAFTCNLCLEPRTDLAFMQPLRKASLCVRCRNQSVRTLERDPDSGWKR